MIITANNATQTLFSASLLAEVLPATWEMDQQRGRELLKELRQLSRGALAEMRTLLLELRPGVLAEADLGDLLRQLAEAVAGRTGMVVQVAVDGECELPEDVRIALYRVAQEALNNVVKHARAQHASVDLRCTTGDRNPNCLIRLVIRDDGVGFDLNNVPQDRLGLGIICERGHHEVHAHNDTANPPILELNKQLGYRRLPGWITWEKTRS